MVKTFIYLILVCVLPLGGCALARQFAVGVSEEELLNVVALRSTALNCLETWPMHSGLIKGALGPRIDEFPAQAVDAMLELDRLAEAYAQQGEGLSDYELGLSLGLRIRLLGAVVQEALQLYAPDIIQYMPLIF